MKLKKDTITIETCPLCKESHTYELNIKRSKVLYNYSLLQERKAKKKLFTRLFSCPVTKKDFQASFSIIEYFGTPIESIYVEGLTNEAPKE